MHPSERTKPRTAFQPVVELCDSRLLLSAMPMSGTPFTART